MEQSHEHATATSACHTQLLLPCLCRCWFRVSGMQRGLQRGGEGPTAALQPPVSQRLHRPVAGAGALSPCVQQSGRKRFGCGRVLTTPHLSLPPPARHVSSVQEEPQRTEHGHGPTRAGRNELFPQLFVLVLFQLSQQRERRQQRVTTTARTSQLETSRRDAGAASAAAGRGRTRVSFRAHSRGGALPDARLG